MQNFRKILENSFVADVEHYASISSTNDRALAAAREANVKLPLLVLADVQTAGRGRGSNRWWTGPGSLAFSLLTADVGWDQRVSARAGPPMSSEGADSGGPALASSPTNAARRCPPPYQVTPRPPTLVALAVGVALVDALTPLALGHELGIHWPNDVMLDGRKLAGILIETLPGGKLVIGVGINTNNTAADAPAEVRPRVATLRDATGQIYDPVELLISILNRLEERLVELARTPQRIAARTNELCLQRGKRLKVTQGTRQIEGRCAGIADDGALTVSQRGQRHAIYSGSVELS